MTLVLKKMLLCELLFLVCGDFTESKFLNPFIAWKDKSQAGDTIIMAHVLFRHGNRTGQKSELYPKDPYLNFTYFPFGNGQLTNVGKRKEFSIGKALRARYDNLLGEYYYPGVVEAISTDYNRTKSSLLLVLASLFQPKRVEVWNPVLNWQPVPYNYLPTKKDKVLYGIACPNSVKLYSKLSASPKLQAQYEQNRVTFDYISKYSGLNVTSFQQVYDLYFGLSTEEEWGFDLPKWTKEVWPKTITDLAIKEYFVQSGTTELIQMAAGYHLKKIIDDTKKKIETFDKDRSELGKKLYLYSAHENNIAQMLILLNVFDGHHIPTYGSYLIFEVHNINKVYGIKLYYQNYSTKNIQLLKLPACDEFCPLDQFISILEEYIPSDDLCGY